MIQVGPGLACSFNFLNTLILNSGHILQNLWQGQHSTSRALLVILPLTWGCNLHAERALLYSAGTKMQISDFWNLRYVSSHPPSKQRTCTDWSNLTSFDFFQLCVCMLCLFSCIYISLPETCCSCCWSKSNFSLLGFLPLRFGPSPPGHKNTHTDVK